VEFIILDGKITKPDEVSEQIRTRGE